MRITIWVKPGSARPGAGGEHDGALVVRVSARAVDGKATEAALAAVAGSFGVRRSAVRLVSGASSRTKIVDIDAGDPRILAALLAAPGRLRPQQDAAAVRPSVISDVPARRRTHGPGSPAQTCCPLSSIPGRVRAGGFDGTPARVHRETSASRGLRSCDMRFPEYPARPKASPNERPLLRGMRGRRPGYGR